MRNATLGLMYRLVTHSILRTLFLSAALFVIPSVVPALADTVILFKNDKWEATVDQGKFYGIIGRVEAITATGPHVRELAFFFDIKQRRFGVLAEKENLRLARGTAVPMVVTFRPSQPNRPIPPLRVSARMGAGQVVVLLSDAELAAWTHGFTAGSAMTVSFPTQDNEQWTYDLAGTTPAITAVAGALGAAGFTDLPPPWRMEGYGAAGVAPAPAPQPPVMDAAAQNRQLAIAAAEAEKAKADAERARAEAIKARADADRAQAEVQVLADVKAKAAEEARVIAVREAAEARRKAAEAKAVQDAKGMEP